MCTILLILLIYYVNVPEDCCETVVLNDKIFSVITVQDFGSK